jgi:hypothetical protein
MQKSCLRSSLRIGKRKAEPGSLGRRVSVASLLPKPKRAGIKLVGCCKLLRIEIGARSTKHKEHRATAQVYRLDFVNLKAEYTIFITVKPNSITECSTTPYLCTSYNLSARNKIPSGRRRPKVLVFARLDINSSRANGCLISSTMAHNPRGPSGPSFLHKNLENQLSLQWADRAGANPKPTRARPFVHRRRPGYPQNFRSNLDRGTLFGCDSFGIQSTSHWMGAATIAQ